MFIYEYNFNSDGLIAIPPFYSGLQIVKITQHYFFQQAGLILGAAIGLGAYLGLVLLDGQAGTLRDEFTPYAIGWYTVAFIGYLLGLVWVEWRPSRTLWLIWGAAIVFRLLLLWTIPTWSDDVYRYLWDGYVANNGVSPYAYPIDSPNLDYLDVPIRALANNQWMASPYLPTAQFLFVTLTRLFPLTPLSMQIAMVAFDLLAALLIAKLLALVNLPAHRILIYLWNPLVIVEVAHGAHIDALMVCLALVAVWLTFQPRQQPEAMDSMNRLSQMGLPPFFLALATLTKILPLFLMTILFWRWRWSQRIIYGVVTLAIMIPFGVISGWGLTGPLDGTGLFGAIRIYADQWNFNSGLFHWLEVKWLPSWGVLEPLDDAKRLIGVGQVFVVGLTWLIAWRYSANNQVNNLASLRLMAIPFMVYLLLTPTVHPWYMLILMIFLPFLPPREGETNWQWLTLLPWLYLSGSLALSYITYVNPLDFREYEWVRETEWMPTLRLVVVAAGYLIIRGLMSFFDNRSNGIFPSLEGEGAREAGG